MKWMGPLAAICLAWGVGCDRPAAARRTQESKAPTPAPAPAAKSPSPEPGGQFPRKEEFVVKPLEGEPIWPDPSDEAQVKKRGYFPFPGGYLFEHRDPSGKIVSSGAVVAGTVLMDRGLIEVLGCAEGGKEHESVFRMECDIQSLDLSLVLGGYQRGPVPKKLNDPTVPQGSRMLVLLQWVDEASGKVVTHRAEDLILSAAIERPMPRVGWTYVGRMIEVVDATAGGHATFRVLAATSSRSMVTTLRDSSSLLDNPLEDSEDLPGPDTLFAANYMVLPPAGTPVRVIVRGLSDPERAEIARVEKELAK